MFSQLHVVSNKKDSVNITCDTDFPGQVTWKQKSDGVEMTLIGSKYIHMTGRTLQLHSLDMPNAGEYSCWGEGRKQNSTYLLLKQTDEDDYVDDEDDDDDDDTKKSDSFSCSTQTYGCSITCHLTASSFTAARLSYHSDRQAHRECNGSRAQDRFQFTLPLSNSPYAEEASPLEVTVEALNSKLYLKKTIHFYLRDIVQPDPPQAVMCEKTGKTLTVTVQPAESWAQPISYFPLEHEIQFKNKDNGKAEHAADGVIKTKEKVSELRARSRDPLIPSAWSKWSPWKNVTN
ncbi:interleukin-12 subunit beta [Conger conger]|uniref:interleukin-12 subunit beta n=1 Tax=Conger conger TaxID=82655 RepID=UPI002A5AA925|nr:interleukin-12 subunit beta [Conger conger]